MSENAEQKFDGGFRLTEMVKAQRGLSDREIEIFLATGQKPDLSQPPPEELERIENERQVMSEQDAYAWLSGATLTASAFFDFDSSHGVSPLYDEVVRPKAFRFDPHQPRDNDGQWTDGPSVVKKPKKAAKIYPGDNIEGIGVIVDVITELSGGKPVKTTVKNEAGESHSLDANTKVTVLISEKTAAPSAKLSKTDEAFDDDNLSKPLPNAAMPTGWRTGRGIIVHDDAVQMRTDALGGDWDGDQRRALNEYTEESADINNALRADSDTVFGGDDIIEYTDALDSAMYPAGKPFTAYRQTTLDTLGVTSVDEVPTLIGTDHTDAAYQSTTISPRLNFQDMPVYMRIDVPKGTRGAYVADLSDFVHQREYILARNTKMTIVKAEVKNGRAFLHMKVVAQSDSVVASAAFRFDPHQPRDEDGKWSDGPLGGVGTLIKKTAASTKKVTPAAIYKKHDDGAVVGHSASGQRMRWDAGSKKYVVEKRQDDKWVAQSSLAKGAAYNELKKPDAWFEPGEDDNDQVNVPSRAPAPSPVNAPAEDTPDASAVGDSLSPSGTKIKPSAIYAKHDDGDTVAQSADGAKRMRWDAGRKKFIVEKQNGDGWAEESALTKGAAYNDAKNPDKWFEPTETSTENEPSSPSLVPEPDLADTDITAETPELPATTPNGTSQASYPPPEPVPMVDPDWPFSFEPFQEPQMDYGHLVRPNDDAYANDPNHDYELKTLPVNTIVPSQENDYEEWGDGLENDMTGKPLAIKKDGNLYLMDGHHRTAKAGENGSIQAWVLDLDKPKEKAKTDAPEIPKQADAPAVESSPLWKPTMSEAEAKDFTADSVVKTPLFHGTTRGADIRENGFQVEKLGAAGGVGGLVGAGHYLTGLESDAKGYAGNGEVLRVAARVMNPVDITSRDAVRSEILKQAMFRKSRGKDVGADWLDGKSGQEGFENETRRDLLPSDWEKLHDDYADIRENRGAQWPSFVQTKWLQDHGYDGAIWRDENGDVKELAVFDDKAVAVIDTPEIPKQADAPEIESTPAATPYVGPTATNYEGAPKATTDALRQAYNAEIAHERRIQARATELRKTDKYTGWDAFTQSENDARAELAGDAPPDHPLADALEMLSAALPDYGAYEKARKRLNYEASLEVSFSEFTKEHGLGELTPEVKADLAKRTKDAFAGKKVAVRVSPKTVEHILSTGRIKSQFETNKSSGKKDIDMRASVETTLFGIDDKPWQNPEKRPIYGYVALDGIRPVGIGSAELGSPSTDQLTQYGNVQIVLKDSVRSRTTAMFGDSLNEMREGTPSPIDDPDYKSFTAGRGAMTSQSLDGLDRSGETAHFRSHSYAEAQIHGGVGVDDIEEIVFPSNPTATIKKQLEDAGIPYRVMNFKTAADGSSEERATALRIAQQDKPLIEGEIAKLQAKLADPKYVGDEFYKKDLAKYEKQLKTINDALPLLEGTKTSPAKKVAAAREKVAKATASLPEVPKQAEAPKIKSAPALGADFADVSSRLAKIFADNEYYGRKYKELFEKQFQKASGVLNSSDQWLFDTAYNKVRQAWKDSQSDREKAIDLLVQRAKAISGDDANSAYWTQRADAKVNIRPKVNKDSVDKIAERYVSKDLVTITNNASLRSGEPSEAALKWVKSMDRMTDSGEIAEDTRVYRGATFSPEFAASLTPGTVMHDAAYMSTGFDDKTAKHYAGERLMMLPGYIPTVFEIRVPGGTRAYEVENDELVFGRGKALRIMSVRQDGEYMRVIVDMLTPEQAKELANG